MASSLGANIDPSRSHFVTILGRKGSGKSILAEVFWRSYPYDRLVIDPTGDVQVDEHTQALTEPLPRRFPSRADGARSSLRYVPDPGSPTYDDDLDRAVGLAFYHRRTLLWVDEVAELTRANRTGPHFRRALHQGRHRQLSLVLCGPRPIDVNPLVISQADYLYVFDLPNPADRRRVADNIGVEPKAFDAVVASLGPFEFVCWDARAGELAHMPAIPLTRR